METTESASASLAAERRSRQHLGIRMGPVFRASIAALHDGQKMTYAEIAASFGFADHSPLFHILAGRRGVSHEKAEHIAKVLGKPLEELREGDH